jgi:23S rRNA (guanosine2251-2'-O)-methyltransferase
MPVGGARPRRGARARERPAERGPGEPLAVVGRRPALEAVRSGLAIEVLVAHDARSTPALRAVVEAAGVSGVPVSQVPSEQIDALARGALHQGVAARVESVPRLGEADLSTRAWGSEAIVVVIDGVTDPQNLGALARTAEAAGAEALIARRRRAAHLGEVALKASAGALLHLPVAEVANIPRALKRLQDARFWVVGLDASARTTILEEPPAGRIALVLGAEGEGLSRLVRESCDELLSIPLRGRVDSLNVAVAAGVALFGYAIRDKKEG